MNYFVIADPNKCIGCRTCMIACVVAHSDKDLFYKNPEDIKFNPKLTVVKTYRVSAPIQCRHCEDAPCANVCPNGAIYKIDNTIKVNEDKCVGCKTCMMACPIGAIDLVTLRKDNKDKFCFVEKIVANKCDLCISSPNGPACVNVCPTKAFNIIKEEDIEESIKSKRKLAVVQVGNV